MTRGQTGPGGAQQFPRTTTDPLPIPNSSMLWKPLHSLGAPIGEGEEGWNPDLPGFKPKMTAKLLNCLSLPERNKNRGLPSEMKGNYRKMREVPLVPPEMRGLWNVFTTREMTNIWVLTKGTQPDFCFWTLNKGQGNHSFRARAVKLTKKEVSPRNKLDETKHFLSWHLCEANSVIPILQMRKQDESSWMTSLQLLGWWG